VRIRAAFAVPGRLSGGCLGGYRAAVRPRTLHLVSRLVTPAYARGLSGCVHHGGRPSPCHKSSAGGELMSIEFVGMIFHRPGNDLRAFASPPRLPRRQTLREALCAGARGCRLRPGPDWNLDAISRGLTGCGVRREPHRTAVVPGVASAGLSCTHRGIARVRCARPLCERSARRALHHGRQRRRAASRRRLRREGRPLRPHR